MKVNLMNELLANALELMIAGVGFVFVFLMALIFAISVVSKIITKYFPDPVVPAAPIAKAPAVPSAQVDAQLLSVISAAVKEYRSHHKK